MKRKKLAALLLAAVTAVSLLGGCGGDTDSSGGSSEAGGEAGESGEQATDTGASSAIDMEEEPYTVAIQVVILPGVEFTGEEEREEAINAITVPAINCKVDIQEIAISEVATKTSMGIASGEKLDLLHVGTVTPLSAMVGSDMLYDMNEDNLLQSRGQMLVEIFGDLLEAGNVSGQQLAVPAGVFAASAKGINYNKTIADEIGLTIPEKITFDELDEILAKVHEARPDIKAFYSGNGQSVLLQWMQPFETFGQLCSYGVVLDSANNMKVENIFATDMYKEYALRAFHWTQDGIQPGDPTDTNTAQDYFMAQDLFCVADIMNPANTVGWQARVAESGFEMGQAVLVDPMITNSGITEYMWGIASNSERPDKAMDFLNFLYSNGEVANILKYGLEGTNYEFAEGSDKIVVANGTYDPMFYVGGDTRQMHILSPAGEDYIDQLQAMADQATTSKLCAYMFDDTDFQTESSVIYSTILEYVPRITCGMCKSEEETLALLDEFNEALEAAGINDVIAANQEQLDAFLAK